MEKIQHFFQLLAAWKFWNSLFHDFIWLDWILLLAVFAAVVIGIYRGFIFFLPKFIYLLAMVFAVILIYPWLAEGAIRYLSFAKPGFWKPVCFIFIWTAFFFIFKRIPFFQPKKGRVSSLGIIDRVLGAIAGFFFMLLLASFVSQFLITWPSKSVAKLYSPHGARYGVVLRNFAPQTVDSILMPVRLIVNRRNKHL